MARRTQTYAIRRAVEGGGQVKAELVSVGQSGEQSLKRIETAGDKASGGLKGLGRQAELLRTGIRTLGRALAGVATAGGLAALVDRSISATDAIGKTADKIGVGVEALQELRFAAKASGVEQQTLDMALQRFTRRAAEAAQGTGEAKDALAQMGIALRDQSGNLRRSAAGRGLWRHPALAPRLPSQIGGTVSRFHMVQGDVLRVVPTERYVYLNSLRLAPRLYGQAAARGTE
jgi:hypothetical protein